jgi:hypothetical protein
MTRVASRGWTRRPRPRGGQLRGGRGGAGHGPIWYCPSPRQASHDRWAISGPLARVTRGQSGSPGTARNAWSAPLTAVTAALPKLIVRVRFSSPAPHRPRSGRRSRLWALIVSGYCGSSGPLARSSASASRGPTRRLAAQPGRGGRSCS